MKNEEKQKNTIHRECHGKKIMAHLPVNKAPHNKPTCKYEVLSNCLQNFLCKSKIESYWQKDKAKQSKHQYL